MASLNSVGIRVWEEVLREYCHCSPDVVGNYPCDNGCVCDRCMAPDVQQVYDAKLAEVGLSRR